MGSTAVIAMETDELPGQAAGHPSAIISVMNTKTGYVDSEPSESRLRELLEAITRRDRTAFGAFYDATIKRVLSLVLRITQQIEIAEEVVSDVYLQVWRQADRFDPARGNALAWLTIICRSRALDALRKSNTELINRAEPISEIPELETADFPQDLLISVEQHTTVHAALEKLEPNQRQLLALGY